ncbi:MAG: hemolysin family protein [Syntrophobacterales bacterium]|nr:hemolysin family protein [Syntrophobacterales bacterium]
MEGNTIVTFLMFCLLFGLSAFFSASETAFMAVNQLRLNIKAEKDLRAQMVKKVLENTEGLLGTLLICNNFVNVSLSSLATSIAIGIVGERGVIYATFTVTVSLLLIGEIIPKTFASYHADSMALRVVPAVRFLMVVFTPLLHCLRWIINGLVKLFGWEKCRQDPIITEEELEHLIGIDSEAATIPKQKQDMLLGVLLLDKTILRDIMIPWRDVVGLPINASREEVLNIIAKTNFSRYPVYEEDPSNVIGFIHVRDVLLATCSDIETFSLKSILRPPPFAPDLRTIRMQLEVFKKERTHVAFVIDEYGNVVGLVTLEDILEEIVGDIEDEYDVRQDRIVYLKDGSWIIDGKVLIRDVNRVTGLDLPEEDVRTIGGLIIRQLQRIPELGETVSIGKIRLQVVSLRGRKIERVRVSL